MKKEKQISFRVDIEEYLQFTKLAATYGVAASLVMRRLLENAVKEWCIPGFDRKPRPKP